MKTWWDKLKDFIEFIMWFVADEVLIAMFKTLFIRKPCRRCLVRACCTEKCDAGLNYFSYCNAEGKIVFQRVCALSIIFAMCIFGWGIYTWIMKT